MKSKKSIHDNLKKSGRSENTQRLYKDFSESVRQIKLHLDGKIKLKDAKDLFR